MRVAILGAGIAGLAAAVDLNKAGHDVTLFEASEQVGGLAAGFRDDHWQWTLEKYYHHWFASDHDVLDLLKELGLEDKVIFKSPITSYYDEAGNFALDKPVLRNGLLSRIANVLSIPGLTFFSRLRLGATAFYLTLIKNGTPLEEHLADSWMRRAAGEKAYNRIWRPMLIGKFGANYDRVNMAWLWARLYKRTSELGSYAGGFQQALEDIRDILVNRGVKFVFSTRITKIEPETTGIKLTAEDWHESYDRMLVTFSPALFAKIAPDMGSYTEKLTSLKGIGALTFVLALDHELMKDGTYWLNLPAKSPEWHENPFPFLALVEHTHFLPAEHYGGDHIVYMGDYLEPDHEHMTMAPEAVLERFLPSLKKVNPEFSPDWIRKWWLFRTPYAQPVPFVNQSKIIPAITTPISGLYFASMAQVYPWDRGTNYAVEIGRRAARLMMGEEEK